ncbi:MAG: hypothetical protein R3B59_01265 [Dehalococcoidia bacterium]
MLDTEDRELILMWGLRATAGMLAVVGGAGTLGLAWRVFELVRG